MPGTFTPTGNSWLTLCLGRNDEDVARNFKIAATESKASFGDDRLLIEKYIEEPRHVEIQILGDRHGNIVLQRPLWSYFDQSICL